MHRGRGTQFGTGLAEFTPGLDTALPVVTSPPYLKGLWFISLAISCTLLASGRSSAEAEMHDATSDRSWNEKH